MNLGRRAVMAVALLATLLATSTLASGCDAVEQGIEAISATTTTIAGAQPAPGGGLPNANALACVTERDAVQLAVDSYTLLEGAAPVSEAALVPDWLRTESQLFDLAPDSSVVPAPGGGC